MLSRVDRAEGVANLGTEQTHHSDHNDGDQSENDRLLDQPLTFFFGSKQQNSLPFDKMGEFSEEIPQPADMTICSTQGYITKRQLSTFPLIFHISQLN